MHYLESNKLNYIIAARFTHPIQHLIDKQEVWIPVDEGIEICNKNYKSISLKLMCLSLCFYNFIFLILNE